MPDPNLLLRDFLRDEQPASAANLFLRLTIARKWNDWQGLPISLEQMESELDGLARGGFAFSEGGDWKLKYQQPEVKELNSQMELFA
jgi:hypothetical protein